MPDKSRWRKESKTLRENMIRIRWLCLEKARLIGQARQRKLKIMDSPLRKHGRKSLIELIVFFFFCLKDLWRNIVTSE